MSDSKATSRNRRIQRLIGALCAAGSIIAALACGAAEGPVYRFEGGGGADDVGNVELPDGSPTIKLYRQGTNGLELREFAPIGLRDMKGQVSDDNDDTTRASEDSSVNNDGSETDVGDESRDKKQNYDGSVNKDIEYGPGATGTAWELLWLAAKDCQRPAGLLRANMFSQPSTWGTENSDFYVWNPNFDNSGLNALCYHHLLYEEDLVCAANKLLEVADSVGSTEWNAAGAVIPPQSKASRVVASELTLNALAHFARIGWADSRNTRPIIGTSAGRYLSCSGQLAWAKTNYGSLNTTDRNEFGSAHLTTGVSGTTQITRYVNGVDLTDANFGSVADAFLEIRLANAKTAATELRNAIDSIADADFDGAQAIYTRNGSAEDAWGIKSNGYNTLRHALWLLLGRLELSQIGYRPAYGTPGYTIDSLYADSHVDPACQGYYGFTSTPPSERTSSTRRDLYSALPRGFDSRWFIKAPRSAGEARAINLFRQAGLVIRKSLWAQPNVSYEMEVGVNTKRVLTAWIRRQAALRSGISLSNYQASGFDTSAQAEAIGRMVETLSGQELRFGAEWSWYRYAAMAGVASADFASSSEHAARGIEVLPASGSLATDLSLAGGSVFATKNWDNDLDIRTPNQLGKALTAATCEHPIYAPAQAACDPASTTAECWSNAEDNYSYAFQGFAGTAYHLKDTLLQIGTTEAKVAANELNDLISGDVEFRVVGRSGITDTPYVRVYKNGAATAETGLKLVYADPWEVDCLLGVRRTCPTSLTPGIYFTETSPGYWLAHPDFAADVTFKNFSDGRFSGRSDGQLYLLKPGTRENPGHIVAVAPPKHGRWMHFMSPLRDELTARLLARPELPGNSLQCVDSRPEQVGDYYCDLGTRKGDPLLLQTGMFIPLANELDGGVQGDSAWEHYLALAEGAAAQADSYGRDLIESGLGIDSQTQGAQTQLIELCGGPVGSGEATFNDNGTISYAGNDTALECTSPKKYEFTFLGSMPTTTTARSLINANYCNAQTAQLGAAPPECADPGDNAQVPDGKVEWVALDLSTGADTNPGSACANTYDITNKLRAGAIDTRSALDQFGADRTLSADKAKLVLKDLSLTLTDEGSWQLRRGAEVLMNHNEPLAQSLENGTWGNDALNHKFPACTLLPSTATGCSAVGDTLGKCCDADARRIQKWLGYSETQAGSFSSDTVFAEVASGLKLLSSLAGEADEGLFDFPLPTREYVTIDLVPPLMVYGEKFVTSSSNPSLKVLAPKSQNGEFFATTTTPDGVTIPGDNDRIGTTGIAFIGNNAAFRALKTLTPSLSSVWNHVTTHTGNIYRVRAKSPARTFLPAPTVADLSNAIFPSSVTNFDTSNIANRQAAPSSATLLAGRLCDCGDPWGAKSPIRLTYPKSTEVEPDHVVPFYTHVRDGFEDTCVTVGGTLSRNCLVSSPWASDGQTSHGGFNEACTCKSYYREIVSPTWTPPAERIWAFLGGSQGPAFKEWVAAGVAIACMADQPPQAISSTVPNDLTSIDDLRLVSAWINEQAIVLDNKVNQLFVPGLPAAAVDYIREGKLPYGEANAGEVGRKNLQIATRLAQVTKTFRAAIENLTQMSGAVTNAQRALRGLEARMEVSRKQLLIERLNVEKRMLVTATQGVGNFINNALTLNFGSIIGTGVELGYDAEILKAVEDKGQLEEAEFETSVGTVLGSLTDVLSQQRYLLDENLRSIQDDLLTVLTGTSELQSIQRAASIQVAQALGAPFATLVGPDGVELKLDLPVNTVRSRQYSYTRENYERALKRAKVYAYMSRLALEQRIGVRFSSLDEPLGPMEPPKQWIDDLCKVSGVDYKLLRDEDAAFDPGEFADQFVGNYVAKLRDLIEQYRVEYPFQEQMDRTVLSLRDEVLEETGTCEKESENLLFHSNALYEPSPLGEAASPLPSRQGWYQGTCEGAECTYAFATDLLSETKTPVTVLQKRPVVAPVPDTLGVAPGVTYQTVTLSPGRHTLSLNHKSPGTSSILLGNDTSGVTYSPRATVTAELLVLANAGERIASANISSNTDWNEARLSFDVAESADYYVGIRLISTGEIRVADVVLQSGEPRTNDPIVVLTGSSRKYTTNECLRGSPEEFRDRFDRVCDDRGCRYVLRGGFALTDSEGTPRNLTGLALGNYNYRHAGLSLNLVGTGITVCEGQVEGCYGNATVEYDLKHTAFDVPLEDYLGSRTCFDFGRAEVNEAKALATERYITLPLATDDEALLNQPGMTQTLLAGRPFAGSYELTIHDSETLDWSNLEDIQLVLTSEHWSRVQRTE
jgi:hypothetical protein